MHFSNFFFLFWAVFRGRKRLPLLAPENSGALYLEPNFGKTFTKKCRCGILMTIGGGMKNKRLATVLRFLSCYCIAMGCVTIFSLFEIVFEDKTEGILWGTAITVLVAALLVWNSRL